MQAEKQKLYLFVIFVKNFKKTKLYYENRKN